MSAPVFVDTSAFYAAIDRSNVAANLTSRLLRRLILDRRGLVTTNFVIAELHALLLTRGNRHLAFTVLRELRESSVLTIERVTKSDENRAWEIIEQYDDKDFSFADATSFAVMERLQIPAAFALGRNFAQFGWTLLPLDDEA